MATRRERVVLELEDRYTTGLARASAATAIFKRELGSASGKQVEATRTSRDLEQQTVRTGQAFNKQGSELDRFTGRAKLLANVAATLMPSIAPIGAVAIPAVTGLASGLGFVTLGVGTAVLAFQGLGDALKAMNAAALDPTDAHLQKAQQTLELLSPAARGLAKELYGLQPLLAQLKAQAGAGLFPGLTEGLDEFEKFIPKVGPVLEAIGTKSGEIAKDVGGSLASGKWDDFLRFLETEGPKALGDFAAAGGHVVHAMAQLWMATTPLNRDFSEWLVDATKDLDNWSSHLAQTEGFQEFIAYVEENGPQVAQTFGAIANAVLQVVEASAPLGGPVLKILESLANTIAAVADSDLGTPIMTMVTALSALRLATAAQSKVQEATWTRGKVKLKSFTTDLRTMGEVGVVAWGRSAEGAKRYDAAAGRVSGTLKKVGGSAVTLGALALAGSGAADSMGLTNTATLALAGSMAGPWGAAIGAGIGLVADLSAAMGPATDGLDAYQARIVTLAGPQVSDQLKAVNAEIEKQQKLFEKGASGPQFKLGGTTVVPFDFSENDWKDADNKLRTLKKTQSELKAEVAKEAAAQEFANSTAGKAALKAREQIAAQQALAKALSDSATKFLDFSAKADNAKVSLHDFITDMQNQADALAHFGDNAYKAADRGLSKGLIKYLNTLGPAGALRMKQLADASESEIHRANKAWHAGEGATAHFKKKFDEAMNGTTTRGPRHEISLLDIAIGAIPRPRKIVFDVETQAVLNKLHALQNRLIMNPLHIAVVPSGIAAPKPKSNPLTPADGTTVPGPRHPYRDRIPALLAPGEEVVSNRHGQADRHRGLLKAINANQMADGGTAGRRSGGSFTELLTGRTGPMNAMFSAIAGAFRYDIPHSLKDWQNALKRSESAIDKERSKRDDLVQAQSELIASVSEKLRSDLFTSSSSSNLSVWLSASQRKKAASGDAFSTLRGDISNATAMKKALATLRKKGLNGAAFADVAQNADLNQAQALAAMSSKNVRGFEWLFNRRQQLTGDVGRFAGSTVYGKDIAAQTKHLSDLLKANHLIAHRLGALEKYAKDNPKAVGKEFERSIKTIGGR